MRGALLIAPVALLSACSQEPSFDEKYEAAAERIGTSAREMDAELEKREAEVEQIEAGEAPPSPPGV